MKSLDRYILKQILLPASLAFTVIAFLGVGSALSSRLEEVPQGFLTPLDIIRLILFILPSLVTLLIPIAYFLGILMAFGRLAQQGEITSMQAAGISLKRMVLPTVLIGILMSVLSFAIQDWLQPWGTAKAFEVIYDELPQRATIDMLGEGEMHQLKGLRIFFAKKDPETHTLFEFDLIQPGEDGVTLFHAAEAQFTKKDSQYALILKNGYTITNNLRLNFDQMEKPLPAPSGIAKRSRLRNSLSLRDLLTFEQYIVQNVDKGESGINNRELHKVREDLAKRMSSPFAALAIAFVGAPLGIQARRKGRTALFSTGFSIMLLYYALQTVVAPSSLSHLYEYVYRAWIPNLMLFALGLFLFWKADRV